MPTLDELMAEPTQPQPAGQAQPTLDEVMGEAAPRPTGVIRQGYPSKPEQFKELILNYARELAMPPALLLEKVFGWDKVAADYWWRQVGVGKPEEVGQHALEFGQKHGLGDTGSAALATGAHVARELATPINLGLPPAVAGVRHLGKVLHPPLPPVYQASVKPPVVPPPLVNPTLQSAAAVAAKRGAEAAVQSGLFKGVIPPSHQLAGPARYQQPRTERRAIQLPPREEIVEVPVEEKAPPPEHPLGKWEKREYPTEGDVDQTKLPEGEKAEGQPSYAGVNEGTMPEPQLGSPEPLPADIVKKAMGPSLGDFLRKKGGVLDEGGELKAMEFDKHFRKVGQRNLVQKNGIAMDKAREAAEEAGYPISSIDDMIEQLRNETHGNPLYSSRFRNEAAEQDIITQDYEKWAASHPEQVSKAPETPVAKVDEPAAPPSPEVPPTTMKVKTTTPGGVMYKDVETGKWDWIDSGYRSPESRQLQWELEHQRTGGGAMGPPPPQKPIAMGGGHAPDPDNLLDTPAAISTSKPERFKKWWSEFDRLFPRFEDVKGFWKEYRGEEIPLWRNIPTTPVITEVEALHVDMEAVFNRVLSQPWMQELVTLANMPEREFQAYLAARPRYIPPSQNIIYREGKSNQLVQAQFPKNFDEWYAQWEQIAHDEFVKWGGDMPTGYVKGKPVGTQVGVANRKATELLPPPLQDYMKFRDARFAEENAARAKRGLDPLPEVLGPYLPRMAKGERGRSLRLKYDYRESGPGLPGSIGQPTGTPVQSGIGSFGRERKFDTMMEGQNAPYHQIEYVNSLKGLLLREIEDAQLISSERFLSRLKDEGILFATPEEAMAANKATVKTGEIKQVGNAWARSFEEGKFLVDHLTEVSTGHTMMSYVHAANTWLRSPSLVNPFPHIIKNMGYKFVGPSGGKFWEAFGPKNGAFWEYWNGRVPPEKLAEFKKVMPFSESGLTMYDQMMMAAPAETFTEKLGRNANKFSRWSASMIFAKADPAMRFARWDQYIKRGMSPMEAANNTWIDLVRYGTRSQAVDAWKSVPANFFVAWRIGTMRTFMKAVLAKSFRAGIAVAAIDTLREIDWRRNGRITHLPADYWERPAGELLSMIFEKPKYTDIPPLPPAEIIKRGVTGPIFGTIVFGPSGQYTANTIRSILAETDGSAQLADYRRVLWGLAQVYDIVPLVVDFEMAMVGKRYDEAAFRLMDIIGLIGLGRHGGEFGKPKGYAMLGQWLPESLVPTAPGVKEIERYAEAREARERLQKPLGDIRNEMRREQHRRMLPKTPYEKGYYQPPRQ